MKLCEVPEGEYVILDITDEVKLVVYQLGLVEGSVIEVEIKTPTTMVINLKPLGRIGISRSLARFVEVEPL